MKIGIHSVFVDYHRRGARNRLAMQPAIGPLIAGLLPEDADVELVNETWQGPDWSRGYDLLFISSLHADFDRARQISHYWRRRGATTVYGGSFATLYPDLCQPFFDSVVVGDPETTVPAIHADFGKGRLKPRYVSTHYSAAAVRPPKFELLSGQSFAPLCFEVTRGCPFVCDFCVLSGLGTRHHTRPIAQVIRDIERGQAAVRRGWPALRNRTVGFADNNLGGDIGYLRKLCAALTPLRLRWYGAVTFNVVANLDLVRLMSKAGCRALYVGLESFNVETLRGMNKKQNVVRKIRAAIDNCRQNGIFLTSGLMISPVTDDLAYLAAVPDHLESCGLHLPTFICFETPIPGTPHFRRLGAQVEAALLPNALLRDFTGYTLTVRPVRSPLPEFVAGYRRLLAEVYTPARRLRKLADDLSYFLPGGYWFPALVDLVDTLATDPVPSATRSLLAGTDTPPPETVPLDPQDFDSAEQRDLIMEPWRVTDASGAVLPQWLTAQPVFAKNKARVVSLAGAATAAMN